MPFVQTRLSRLFVQELGDGPAVTLWHCFLGDAAVWHAQATALSDSHRVILVDGPSHGRSDPLQRRFTLEECADAWVEAMDQLGVQKAVFGGVSWGAMVALRVAIRHPQRVIAVVACNAIATAPPPKARARFVALAQAIRFLGIPSWLQAMMGAQMVSARTRATRPNLVSEMVARSRGLDRRALSHAVMSIMADPHDIVAQLRNVELPMMVITGAQDRTTPPACSRTIARAVDGAKLQVLEDVGHLSPLEAPEEVTRLLEQFIRGLGQPDSQNRPVHPSP